MILSEFLSLLLTHLVKVCHLHNVDDHYERKKFSYVIEGCNALPLTTYDVERAISDMLHEYGISSSEINEFRHKIPESFLKYVKTFDLDLELCLQNKTQLVRVGNYPLDGPSPLIPYNKNSRNPPTLRRFIQFDPTRHIIYDDVPHSITLRHSFDTIVTNRHLLQLLMLHDTSDSCNYYQLYQNGERRLINKYSYYRINFNDSIRLQIQQIVNDIVSDYMYIFCGGITSESSSIITDYLGAYVFLGNYEPGYHHEMKKGDCISRILYSSDVVLNNSEDESEDNSYGETYDDLTY